MWPEDTLEEGMAACEDAESWRLDSRDTALRFARDVLKYPEPYLGDAVEDWGPQTIRHHAYTRGVKGVFLGMLIDVRKYDRCWFVVGAEPREGGWVPALASVYRAGRPLLVINPSAPRTEVGYGSEDFTTEGTEQVLFDLSEVEPDATGHVLSLSCDEVCNAEGRPLGYVLPPAEKRVVSATERQLARDSRVCPGGPFTYKSQGNALVAFYRTAVGAATGRYNVNVRNREQLASLGLKALGGDRWSFTIEDSDVRLDARIPRLQDCWHIFSIQDPAHSPIKSVRLGEEAVTFELRWGKATSAEVVLASIRGSAGTADWEGERLRRPVTVQLHQGRVKEPVWVRVALRDTWGLVAFEQFWYRTRSRDR